MSEFEMSRFDYPFGIAFGPDEKDTNIERLSEQLMEANAEVERLKVLLEEGIRRMCLLLEIKEIADNGPITERASRRWMTEALSAVQKKT